MTRSGAEPRRAARDGPRPVLAPVPAAAPRAAEPDDIDEALDDLVTTVDDLVRGDPEEPPLAYVPPRHPEPARLHTRAFVAAVVLALIAIELVVLAWFLSNL